MSETPALSPRRRRTAAALAAGCALALTLAGCGGSSGSAGGTDNTGVVQSDSVITTVPAGQRHAAPDLSGTTVDGRHLALSDFPGKIIVLNVWGSWCSPCRAEAPNLEAVAKETAGRGVQFVGINTRDLKRPSAQAFERSFGLSYQSLYDPDGRLVLKFANGTLSPQAIPSTLILDRRHRIAVRALEALTTGELRKALDPIIAEK